jgi:hypothetical protein
MTAPFENLKRQHQPREMQMVAEYLAKTYPVPPNIVMQRVRLGSPVALSKEVDLTSEEMAMLKVRLRWADAIVITGRELIVIEGAIRPDLGDPCKILLYIELVALTHELSSWAHLPVKGVYLYCIQDDLIISMCHRLGFQAVQYVPSWLPEYLSILYPRERRAPLGK